MLLEKKRFQPIQKLLILFLLALTIVSCKNECYLDVNALNFDAEADTDGTCRYTKVIFHAPGDMVGGMEDKVEKIEIFRGPTPGEELIGAMMEMNQSAVTECVAPEDAIEYELTNGDMPFLFLTRYYFDNDTNESGETYEITASNDQKCIVEELTL